MAQIKEDLKWQAEDDARTLMRREEILASPDRRKRAMAALREQQKNLAKSLNTANRITNSRASGGKITRRKK